MNRPDPLTPEERELARLLGRPAPAAPSAAVDEAVLAAARAAVQPGAATEDPTAAAAPVRSTSRPRSRLPAVFGLAASLVFAVGIAWQLKPEAPPPAAPVTAAAEATGDALPAADVGSDAAAEKPLAARAVSAPKPAPVPLPPPSAPARALPAQAPVSPAPMAAPMAAPSPPDTMVAADQAAAPDSVGVTGSRISESRERTQAKGAPGVMRRAAPAPAFGALSAGAITVAVDADAALPRRQWIKRIRERRDDGDVDTARASLERYLQHYPEARIPSDLRELLDPH
ncbi:hypothetical protein J7J08_03590 [Stenotrophomonas sp. ISL-67]|uniref:hypothetical protein n=1 Tax=Stenotrophomonas sp. ISL-67 TaxID=2819171 RepID=UPI001BEB685B|nr:hypothetical protein [Stenotrophomonas sp. ISL-67]MBT2766711.1 hypothetical protein [Stenotrophomonas sp. ISL-67]